VRALERKLFRDLDGMKGQVITIGLVVAAGVAGFASLQSTFDSLTWSRDRYYREYRFADLFAHLKRAPERVRGELEAVPGVARVHTRVVEAVRLPIEGMTQTAVGQVVSIPTGDPPPLNAYRLVAGRLPRAGVPTEALLLDAFADRHGLRPGDVVPVILNGTRRELQVVGLATSPEFIYPVSGGHASIPDDERFAVIWMERDAIAPAFEMEGAFNDVVFRLQPGARERTVQAAIDRILEPYGGVGSVGRDLQPSNYVLDGELSQLDSYATVVPIIFLSVAAFLVNVVLSRLVQLQRVHIAALKAMGYSDGRISLHYLVLAWVIVLIGVVGGTGLGAWLGKLLTNLYGSYFGIPLLTYRLHPTTLVIGAAISLIAGFVGAVTSVRGIVRLPPAEAMRPAPPASYRRTLLERTGIQALFGQSGRMVIREIGRRPLRTSVSAVGIAMAVGVLVVGRFAMDALEYLIDVQFNRAWREDVTVVFTQPRAERATREVGHLPGVIRSEGLRAVAVRWRSEHRWRDGVLFGYPDDGRLRQLVTTDGEVVPIPERGLVLTRKLGEIIGVAPGDRVTVEVREGARPTVELPVVALVDEMFGLQGHMRLPVLASMLGEEPSVSMAVLNVDARYQRDIRERTTDFPLIADVTTNDEFVRHFREESGEYWAAMTAILTLFAGAIAVGVIYNNARISLSVRSRDLASLRVLGFTKREIASVLLGELSIQVLLSIPLGMAFGRWLAEAVMGTVDPERYRLPAAVAPETYAFALLVVIASAIVSALLVRHKVYGLDLIAVLKTRE
jgi:putative ABC transport system permease protein